MKTLIIYSSITIDIFTLQPRYVAATASCSSSCHPCVFSRHATVL